MARKFTLGSSENLPGMRLLRGYKLEKAAKAMVKKVRREGFKAKTEKLMGTWEVWVSPGYLKKHPRAKGANIR